MNGLAYAESLLPPGTAWAHVTVVLDQSADFIPGDGRACAALQSRILRRIGDFLRSRGLPAMYLCVREVSPIYEREHSHILLPIPPHLRGDLEAVIRRAGRLHDTSNNRAVLITPRKDRNTGEPDTRGLDTPGRRVGVLMDFLKTMSSKAVLDGVRVMPAIGIDNRGKEHPPVHGKRVFISENLHRAARAAAGWRELTTLPELRAALGGVIDAAEKERNRRKQARHRARKAGPTMPPPSSMPLPTRHPDPLGLDDLAADFFD